MRLIAAGAAQAGGAGSGCAEPLPQPAGSAFVVAIGASTGGPPAMQRMLEAMAAEPSACLLVCQHMPPQFTKAFAERLDRLGHFTVKEAQEGDLVEPGHVFIAPGGRHLLVVSERRGGWSWRRRRRMPGTSTRRR